MNRPTRQIYDVQLSDLLGTLRYSTETVLPVLQKSNEIPTYEHTTEEGIEIYKHEGRSVEVHPGEVIDSHGNIVNLRLLGALGIIIERTEPQS